MRYDELRRLGTALVATALASAACGDSASSDGGTTDDGASDDSPTTSGEGSEPDGDTGDDGETDGGGETGTDTGGDTDTGEDTGPPPEPETLLLFDNVVFYDGYAETVDEPVPDDVIRLSNALYATRLTQAHLDSIQTILRMQVVIGALCDNYDRIGSVNLAIVPQGAEDYDPGAVDRLELARFITPFMDMNKQPDTVPFEYDLHDVVPILKDESLLADHDLWLELSVFGVPYAANNEVAGCAGRNDTSRGSLALYTDSSEEARQFDLLIPLAISERFNNYAEGASDAVGTTKKTIAFELLEDTDEAQVVFIISNHGANSGGEEYNRREHKVYVDGSLAMVFTPGRESCEPFRMYNTQANGIYGPYPRTDEEWQSFSNWCPGDVIDTRVFSWGPVAAGTHEFVIDVPDAVFADGQGNFPLSLYVQAR